MSRAVPTLSAIIITKNEAGEIAECLDALRFCDEIVVVDSGSSDGTAETARDKGARVEQHAFEGFGPQKQYALSLAKSDWVLSIDADERISAALAAEIKAAIVSNAADGYEIPRLSFFCGKAIRHGGWWPDPVLRLIRRERASFSPRLVHERMLCDGKVARLTEPLMHYTIRTRNDALERIERYSTIGAQVIVQSGRRVTFADPALHGGWAFLRAYVLRAGFLDGAEGLMVARYQAANAYYRYAKARLLKSNR